MWKKIESFVRKHSHMFVFFGALIVFLTFVAKEGLANRWEHNAEMINRARDMFALRSGIRYLAGQVKEVRDYVLDLQSSKSAAAGLCGSYTDARSLATRG